MSADVQKLLRGVKSTPLTKHDSTEQPRMVALYVGTGGILVGQLRNDSADRTFLNVADGALLPFDFKLIKSTTTTVADLIAIVEP